MNIVLIAKTILRKPMAKVFLIFLLLTFLASTLVLYFEKNTNPTEYTNIWDSIWWALVTVFTVGYGDIRPITIGGRMVAIVVMFAGISLLSLITATVSSIFVSKKIREDQGLETIKYENHIVVCGWNDQAESIIESIFLLSEQPPKMIFINELSDEQINSVIDKFRKYKVKFVRGDYTRHAALERANIKRARTALLLPNLSQTDPADADEKTILATLGIKSIASNVRVIAFILNQDNEAHIKRAKVDDVFVGNQFAEYLIASHVIQPGLPKAISQFLNPNSKNLITLHPIPPKYRGKKFKELSDYFQKQHHFILFGILAEVESVRLTDFLSSDTSQLDAFIERKLKEAGKALDEENKVLINLNPDEDYIIQENEKAIILK